VSFPSDGHAPGAASPLGFDEDPAVPGDPQVLQQVVDDFAYLRDVAWSVSQGLDAVVASSLSGGFAGEVAEALRQVVSGRLKAFVVNVGRAFSLAGEAVAQYRAVVVAAQQVVGDARLAGDAGLVGWNGRVQDQVDRVGAAARVMEAALRDAAGMVSQPVRVPSLWGRVRGKVESALSIAGGVLALLSAVVDGPIGLALSAVAFGAGAGALGLTAADYKEHRATWWMVALAAVGVLAPGAEGMVSMEALGAGAWAVLGAAGPAAVKTAQVVSSPGRWAGMVARGVAGAPGLVGRGLIWLPMAAWRGTLELPEVLGRAPGFFREVSQSASAAIGRDLARVVKWYPGLVAGVGTDTGYVLVNVGRAGLALFTPLRFADMAQLGFRGAGAALLRRGSWAEAVADFRAGWNRYGARAGRAGVGMAAMLHRDTGLVDALDSPVFPRTRAGLLVPVGSVLPAAEPVIPGVPVMRVMFHRAQGPEPVTVTPCPERTALMRPGGMLRGAPQLEGARVQLVHEVGREPRLEVVGGSGRGTLFEHLPATPPETGGHATPEWEPETGVRAMPMVWQGTPALRQVARSPIGETGRVEERFATGLAHKDFERSFHEPADPQQEEEALSSARAALLSLGLDPSLLHGLVRGRRARILQFVVDEAHRFLRMSGGEIPYDAGVWDQLRYFTITEPDPGHSIFVHHPSGISVEFRGGRIHAREVPLRDVPPAFRGSPRGAGGGRCPLPELEGLRVRLGGEDAKPDGITGPSARTGGLSVARTGHEAEGPGGFTVTDETTDRVFRFGAGGGYLTPDHAAPERPLPDRLPADAAGQQLDAVATEQLISHAMAAVRAAGMDPAELLPWVRALRTQALERLGNETGDGGSRAIPLRAAAEELAGLTVSVTESSRYELSGASELVAQFAVASATEVSPGAGHAFAITNMATGHRYYFGAEGTEMMRDVWVGDKGQTTGLGYMRFDHSRPYGEPPLLVDEHGNLLTKLQVTSYDGFQVELRPNPVRHGAPGEQLLLSAHDGEVLKENFVWRKETAQKFRYGYVQGDPGTRWIIDHGARIIQHLRNDGTGREIQSWWDAPFRWEDGSFVVIPPASGANGASGRPREILRRPALGFECTSAGSFGGAPPWLTGRGTGTRLPLDRAGAYLLGGLPEYGLREVRVSRVRGRLALTDLHGEEVPDVHAEFGRDADRLTVRVAVSREPDAGWAEYWFDKNGLQRRQQWPVPRSGTWQPPDSLAVVLHWDGPRLQKGLWAESPDLLDRFLLGELPKPLRKSPFRDQLFAGLRLEDLFTITDRDTRIRRYYSTTALGLPIWDVPLDQRGKLRVLGAPDATVHTGVFEDSSKLKPKPTWRAEDLGEGWVIVAQDFGVRGNAGTPLLVSTHSGALQAPSDYVKDAYGATARFATPGAAEGATAEYRFAANGHVVAVDLPLTGGGAAEAHLGELRVVARRTRDAQGQETVGILPAGRRYPDSFQVQWTRELLGTAAAGFQVHGVERDAELWKELRGGFTLVEWDSLFRRHYDPLGGLAYRDLPVGAGRYLRIGVGARTGALRVVGAHGEPLAGWRAERVDDGQVAVWDQQADNEQQPRIIEADPAVGRPAAGGGKAQPVIPAMRRVQLWMVHRVDMPALPPEATETPMARDLAERGLTLNPLPGGGR
jgi:hypothetical protein